MEINFHDRILESVDSQCSTLKYSDVNSGGI